MNRWVGWGWLLALLLGGLLGCDRPKDPIPIDKPMPTNRFPAKK
ncbi:MAG TPA: hypothetical protein VKD72_26525 [Gemmataceae bacterium]|nr:hypothetical protein [Gemmataceae bacterium]